MERSETEAEVGNRLIRVAYVVTWKNVLFFVMLLKTMSGSVNLLQLKSVLMSFFHDTARPYSCPWSGYTPEVFLRSKSWADYRLIVISGQTAAKCSVWAHFPIVARVRLCYHERVANVHTDVQQPHCFQDHTYPSGLCWHHGPWWHLETNCYWGPWHGSIASGVLMSILCFMTRQRKLAPAVWASDNRSHPPITNSIKVEWSLQWEQTPNLWAWMKLSPLASCHNKTASPKCGTIDPTHHHVYMRAGQDDVGMGVLSLALIW